MQGICTQGVLRLSLILTYICPPQYECCLGTFPHPTSMYQEVCPLPALSFMDSDNFYISVSHAGVERTWTLEDDRQNEV